MNWARGGARVTLLGPGQLTDGAGRRLTAAGGGFPPCPEGRPLRRGAAKFPLPPGPRAARPIHGDAPSLRALGARQ